METPENQNDTFLNIFLNACISKKKKKTVMETQL